MEAEPAKIPAADTQDAKTDSTEPPKAKSLGPLRMIWRESAKYPRQVLLALIALVTTASAMVAIPARIKVIIDQAFGTGAQQAEIDHAFYYLLMIVIVLGLGTALRFYFVSWLGERVVADIRGKVHRNLLRLAPGFFEENSPKEISSRMTADTALIEQVVGTTVSVALRNAIMAVLGTTYLFWLAPGLASMLLIAIPLIIIPIVLFGRRLRNVSRTSQDRVADVGAMVTEVLGAMKIVQAFNQEDRESARFSGAVEETFTVAKRRILIRAVMTALIMFLVVGGITMVMWRGAVAVSTGEISGGTIAAFVFTGGLVAGAFGSLTEVYGDLLRGAGAASRLNELLNEQPDIAPP
ncbi:MAG: ABC transporter, partial [Novosphingobium sp.]|nr:ABC transporter [Novosphingobium sp.]